MGVGEHGLQQARHGCGGRWGWFVWGVMQPCRSSGFPAVVADQATEDLAPYDVPFESADHGSVGWMQVKRPVWPTLVVVADELGESPSKVAFVQDDDVVEALCPRRANPTFRASIQIG